MKPGEDIDSCVRRGLSEELIFDVADCGISFKVLAIILEPKVLSLAFIVHVDISLDFNNVLSVWPHAKDFGEHDQLVAANVNLSLFKSFAESGNCQAFKSGQVVSSHPDRLANNSHDEWELHPTTLTRMACAIWAEGQS